MAQFARSFVKFWMRLQEAHDKKFVCFTLSTTLYADNVFAFSALARFQFQYRKHPDSVVDFLHESFYVIRLNQLVRGDDQSETIRAAYSQYCEAVQKELTSVQCSGYSQWIPNCA